MLTSEYKKPVDEGIRQDQPTMDNVVPESGEVLEDARVTAGNTSVHPLGYPSKKELLRLRFPLSLIRVIIGGLKSILGINRKTVATGSFILAAVLAIFLVVKWYVEPTVQPTTVRVSNKTDAGFTVSWTTPGVPTKGSVYVVSASHSWVPVVSSLTERKYNDERDLFEPLGFLYRGRGRYVTHYVNIESPEPKSEYSIHLQVGSRVYSLNSAGQDIGEVTTFPVLVNSRTANPSYGKVMEDDYTVSAGTIVYARVLSATGAESSLLSGLTNSEGGYWYDPAIARNMYDGSLFSTVDGFRELVLVEGGDQGRTMRVVSDGSVHPLADVVLDKPYSGDIRYGVSLSQRLESVEKSVVKSLLPESRVFAASGVDVRPNRISDSNFHFNIIGPDAVVAFIAVILCMFGLVVSRYRVLYRVSLKAVRPVVMTLVIFHLVFPFPLTVDVVEALGSRLFSADTKGRILSLVGAGECGSYHDAGTCFSSGCIWTGSVCRSGSSADGDDVPEETDDEEEVPSEQPPSNPVTEQEDPVQYGETQNYSQCGDGSCTGAESVSSCAQDCAGSGQEDVSQCEHEGGECMTPSVCKSLHGVVEHGKCPGGANNKCCKNKPDEQEQPKEPHDDQNADSEVKDITEEQCDVGDFEYEETETEVCRVVCVAGGDDPTGDGPGRWSEKKCNKKGENKGRTEYPDDEYEDQRQQTVETGTVDPLVCENPGGSQAFDSYEEYACDTEISRLVDEEGLVVAERICPGSTENYGSSTACATKCMTNCTASLTEPVESKCCVGEPGAAAGEEVEHSVCPLGSIEGDGGNTASWVESHCIFGRGASGTITCCPSDKAIIKEVNEINCQLNPNLCTDEASEYLAIFSIPSNIYGDQDGDGVSLASGDCDDTDPAVVAEIQCQTRYGRSRCSSNTDCPSGEKCDPYGGGCHQGSVNFEGSSCRISLDCGSGYTCFSGRCIDDEEAAVKAGIAGTDVSDLLDDCIAQAGSSDTAIEIKEACRDASLRLSYVKDQNVGVYCPTVRDPSDCDGDGFDNELELLVGANPYVDDNKESNVMGRHGLWSDKTTDLKHLQDAENILDELEQEGYANIEKCLTGDDIGSGMNRLGCLELSRRIDDIGLEAGELVDFLPTGGLWRAALRGSDEGQALDNAEQILKEETGIPAAESGAQTILKVSSLSPEEMEILVEKMSDAGYDTERSGGSNEEMMDDLNAIGFAMVQWEWYQSELEASGADMGMHSDEEMFRSIIGAYVDIETYDLYKGFIEEIDDYSSCLQGDTTKCMCIGDVSACPYGGVSQDAIALGARTASMTKQYELGLVSEAFFAVADFGDVGQLLSGAVDLAGRALIASLSEESLQALVKKGTVESLEGLTQEELENAVKVRITEVLADSLSGGNVGDAVEELRKLGVSDADIDRLLADGDWMRALDEIDAQADNIVELVDETVVPVRGGDLGEVVEDEVPVAVTYETNPDCLLYEGQPVLSEGSSEESDLVSSVYAIPRCIKWRAIKGRSSLNPGDQTISKQHYSVQVQSDHTVVTNLSATNSTTVQWVDRFGNSHWAKIDKSGTSFYDPVTKAWNSYSQDPTIDIYNIPPENIYVYANNANPVNVGAEMAADEAIPIRDLAGVTAQNPGYAANISTHAARVLDAQVDFMERVGIDQRTLEGYYLGVRSRPIQIENFPAGTPGSGYATGIVHMDAKVAGKPEEIIAHELAHLDVYGRQFEPGKLMIDIDCAGFSGQSVNEIKGIVDRDGSVGRAAVEGLNEFANHVSAPGMTSFVGYPEQYAAAQKLYNDVASRAGKPIADKLLAYRLLNDNQATEELLRSVFGQNGNTVLYNYFRDVPIVLPKNIINDNGKVGGQMISMSGVSLECDECGSENISGSISMGSESGYSIVSFTSTFVSSVSAAEDATTTEYALLSGELFPLVVTSSEKQETISMGTGGQLELGYAPGYYRLDIAPYDLLYTFFLNASQKVLTVPLSIDATAASGIFEMTLDSTGSSPDHSLDVQFFVDKNGNNVQEADEPFYSLANTILRFKKIGEGMTYDLNAGWNMISVPVEITDFSASDFLSEVALQGGYATTIAKFESGRWISYAIRGDKVYSDEDFAIIPGEGYMVQMQQEMSIQLTGVTSEESGSIDVNEGWNLVGFQPGVEKEGTFVWSHETDEDGSWTARQVLEQMQEDGVNGINMTRYENSRYEGIVFENNEVYGFDYAIDIGQGYFVLVKSGSRAGPWKL